AGVAFPRRELEPGDGALGDFGRGHELGDGAAQRVLVGPKELEPAVEQHAISDGEHEQNRNQHVDDESHAVGHDDASIRLPEPPAISNIATVVFGLRNGLAMRTATRSPTRPMRPSVSVTLPQRTITCASAFRSSIKVSPTSSFIIFLSGSRAS